MKPICQMQSIVELRSSLVRIKDRRFAYLEGFIFYVSQRRKEGSILVFWKLPTYPSPKPTLALCSR